MSVTANLGANSYCPSSVAEIIKVVRSEEGEVEGEGGRGSPGYLTAPSDVFGGWAFDNISGEKRTCGFLCLFITISCTHTRTCTLSLILSPSFTLSLFI